MNSRTLFIILVLYPGLSINMAFGSENKQGWLDWFLSKLASSSTVSVAVEKAKAKTIAKGIKLAGEFSGMDFDIITDIFDLFFAFREDIGSIISSYQIGSIDQNEAIEKIKNDLFIIVNNQLLYPTRSSKIHALLKKDEFLQYVNDQDNLVENACNQLIQKISALDYSETKKATDKVIDDKMAILRAAIIHGQSLTEQIQELEKNINQKQHFDIPEMQAYLSMYFRLKNKLNVEGKLTKEEKESRQPWIFKPKKEDYP